MAATTFAAYPVARAGGLPLAQQRTAATLVTLILSLAVLTLLAMPLTWRRVILVGAGMTGFVLLFPVAVVRGFYALELPRAELGVILLIAAAGVAALTLFWKLASPAGRAGNRDDALGTSVTSPTGRGGEREDWGSG